MRAEWFDEWHDRGVGFFIHAGPHANVPGPLRQEFAQAVYPDLTYGEPGTLGKHWGNADRYEYRLPPEYLPFLRDWCAERGTLERAYA